jgi:hypothetical protein
MGAMAFHGYSSMELKSRSFTSKEPHVAREPQVADPWDRRLCGSRAGLDAVEKGRVSSSCWVSLYRDILAE